MLYRIKYEENTHKYIAQGQVICRNPHNLTTFSHLFSFLSLYFTVILNISPPPFSAYLL